LPFTTPTPYYHCRNHDKTRSFVLREEEENLREQAARERRRNEEERAFLEQKLEEERRRRAKAESESAAEIARLQRELDALRPNKVNVLHCSLDIMIR
jgi:flagellar biosynthesis GTPase FlhF